MSAVDELRKYDTYDVEFGKLVDAAIAELEAEVEWHEGQSKLDVERIAELEAALAALKARRCDNCERGDPSTAKDDPDVYCGYHSTWWKADQFCSEWSARAEEGSE